jgi:hypothetical protein
LITGLGLLWEGKNNPEWAMHVNMNWPVLMKVSKNIMLLKITLSSNTLTIFLPSF